MDRGYLGSPRVAALAAQDVTIRAKAWTSTNGGRFPKQAFTIDLATAQVVCPVGQRVAVPAGARAVHFPTAVCQPCARRAACTTSARGGRPRHVRRGEGLAKAELTTKIGVIIERSELDAGPPPPSRTRSISRTWRQYPGPVGRSAGFSLDRLVRFLGLF
jgi:hypothetical protein